MSDVFTPEKRSEIMSRIRSKDTEIELGIRSDLHQAAYRYRLYVKHLPGKPDLVLPRYRTAIQIRGCFWHGHSCRDGQPPKLHKDYWIPKLEGNIRKDRRNDRELRRLGWSVLTVWGCHCKSKRGLEAKVRRISSFLERKKRRSVK